MAFEPEDSLSINHHKSIKFERPVKDHRGSKSHAKCSHRPKTPCKRLERKLLNHLTDHTECSVQCSNGKLHKELFPPNVQHEQHAQKKILHHQTMFKFPPPSLADLSKRSCCGVISHSTPAQTSYRETRWTCRMGGGKEGEESLNLIYDRANIIAKRHNKSVLA